MARSTFRLEPLLKIRRLEEDLAKRVVADRLRKIRQVEQGIGSLERQLLDAADVMRSLVLAGPIVPGEATRQRGYIGWLQGRRMQAHLELQELLRQLAAERAALAEASKRRKILEKLKERQEQRRARQQELAERRSSDEMSILRFAHRRSEVGRPPGGGGDEAAEDESAAELRGETARCGM